jgi:hypothetical protein
MLAAVYRAFPKLIAFATCVSRCKIRDARIVVYRRSVFFVCVPMTMVGHGYSIPRLSIDFIKESAALEARTRFQNLQSAREEKRHESNHSRSGKNHKHGEISRGLTAGVC